MQKGLRSKVKLQQGPLLLQKRPCKATIEVTESSNIDVDEFDTSATSVINEEDTTWRLAGDDHHYIDAKDSPLWLAGWEGEYVMTRTQGRHQTSKWPHDGHLGHQLDGT